MRGECVVGFFYSNITLKGPTQEQLATYLRLQQRDAYVSPTVNDITVVYDRECEDLKADVLHTVASHLSRAFECPALVAYLFDDDVLWYALYQHGHCVDTYNSVPDYFDDDQAAEPSGGDAAVLCAAFDVEHVARDVDALLHFAPLAEDDNGELVMPEGYLPAEQQHQALARTLGFPAYSSSMGYFSIVEGNVPEAADLSKLVKTAAHGNPDIEAI
jgi:hypothetical protein